MGAVIVRDGQEVARAFHTYDGIKHAEALALDVWSEQQGPGLPLDVVVSDAALPRLAAPAEVAAVPRERFLHCTLLHT